MFAVYGGIKHHDRKRALNGLAVGVPDGMSPPVEEDATEMHNADGEDRD